MLDEEYHKLPMNILNILIRRKADGVQGYDAPVPTLLQIRGFKRRFIPTEINKEFEKVQEVLTKLSYENIQELDDRQTFTYGVKMGTGSEEDPFVACFSCKHLLKNITKHSNQWAIFHIDGTYKLIKKRFPVLVYGRSDMNGALHLISMAIVSAESTELFEHFYRYI